MKDVILHIGLPKTGTSSLQHYLSEHADALKGQGICYPQTGRAAVAHHPIANACRRVTPLGGDFRDLGRSLFQEARGFDRLVISSEALHSKRGHAGLVYLFGPPRGSGVLSALSLGSIRRRSAPVRTVCYFRELIDMAASGYAQKIQNSSLTLTFRDFCRSRFGRVMAARTDFWKWFSDDVQFGLFDRSRLKDGDIVSDFFDRIGAEMPGAASPRDANPSISGNLLGFKLFLNANKVEVPKLYNVLSELAREEKAWSGRFRITDREAADLRQVHGNYNKTLTGLVGDLPMKSFEGGNEVFDLSSWQADVERFLQHPRLSGLREDAEFRSRAVDIKTAEALKSELGF